MKKLGLAALAFAASPDGADTSIVAPQAPGSDPTQATRPMQILNPIGLLR